MQESVKRMKEREEKCKIECTSKMALYSQQVEQFKTENEQQIQELNIKHDIEVKALKEAISKEQKALLAKIHECGRMVELNNVFKK